MRDLHNGHSSSVQSLLPPLYPGTALFVFFWMPFMFPHCSDSILYLDIDRLHVINETFGMHVGDDVIVSVAECMAKALPAKALSARISGDRLAALIPNSRWRRPPNWRSASGRPPQASCRAQAKDRSRYRSLGGRSRRARRKRARACLATAEIACKAAKDRGRNRVEVFQDSDQSIIRRHTDILVIGKLREALGQRQLPARCAADPAASRQLRTAALRAPDPHAGRPRRDHSAREIPLLGRALPTHADGRSLGRAPGLRAARRAQRRGRRRDRPLRDQLVRASRCRTRHSSTSSRRRSGRAGFRRTRCVSS